MKQPNPPPRWIGFAKEDLVALYGKQNRPEMAAKYLSR